MNPSVVAIGLDGTNTKLLDQWLDSGRLPAIRAIMDAGISGRHSHVKQFRNERCWDLFLSGDRSDNPGSRFVPATYDYYNLSLQREDAYVPFYALGEQYRTCVFDLPAAISDRVNGFQVFGWGSELNVSTPISSPATLLGQLHGKYGSDPKLTKALKVYDHETREVENSYILPNLYDPTALGEFKDKALISIARRTAICLDLLGRENWDLFLALYPEAHTANHAFWHLGESHPLNRDPSSSHAQLEILQAIDGSIGAIQAKLPKNTNLMVYSLDDTVANTSDVPTMALLPELIFRWNYPGESLLAATPISEEVPPLRLDYSQHWKYEIWSLTTHRGKQLLESPAHQEALGEALSWNPASWYKPLWPTMKAFALPSISDGYIRLNIKGREAAGIIDPADFEMTVQQLTDLLRSIINPRTGRPAVKTVTTARKNPFESPSIPPDMIVGWDDSAPADCLDCAELGRVGPVPYFRSGGHVAHGTRIENMFAVSGPGIGPANYTGDGKVEDLSATILYLLNAQQPAQLTGSSLIDRTTAAI